METIYNNNVMLRNQLKRTQENAALNDKRKSSSVAYVLGCGIGGLGILCIRLMPNLDWSSLILIDIITIACAIMCIVSVITLMIANNRYNKCISKCNVYWKRIKLTETRTWLDGKIIN